ncbi:hypothetical protein AZ34_02180 [Hylemonella gracilis str. Niagara R]|uniref:Uncharacterized protein n=1 Tax=Hylemonella gracilis str. Niagara R TaxID=1458275 RepID=A0A016XKX8_9BURK|nr:hypothetical protein [Hylemonella gracilis]EYC52754.1 hypothetical protein AZ34_02180 [Hylemonella gracilis str. Niagara R]
MLEVENQAAGLAALAVESSPRIVALAGHEDARSELPLLMQLCAAWTNLDYPLVVLDAHVSETDQVPGLSQLLRGDEDFTAAVLGNNATAWPIVPAALGLEQLLDGAGATTQAKGKVIAKTLDAGQERARQLATLFPGYELILVYAPAAVLARVWQGSNLSPLLPVSVQESALLSAYQALKQMLSLGKLRPTIVTVMQDAALTTRMSGHNISRNLQECARDFLACETPALTVCPDRPEEMQRLALRSLEAGLQPQDWDLSAVLAPAYASAPNTRRGAAVAAGQGR